MWKFHKIRKQSKEDEFYTFSHPVHQAEGICSRSAFLHSHCPTPPTDPGSACHRCYPPKFFFIDKLLVHGRNFVAAKN